MWDKPRSAFALLACALMVACGGSDTPEPEPASAPESFADAMSQMQKAAEQMSKGGEGEVALIPAQTLQERLPPSIDGMERVSSERNEGGAMGMKVSTAKASYRSEDNREISIEVTDMGGTGMLAMMGAAWAMVDMDRTTQDGYERTVTIEGNRGFEMERRYGGTTNHELSVIVGNRVLTKLEGENVSMDLLRSTLRDLRLGALVPSR